MTIPERMTAIAIERPGGPQVLKPVSRPVPRLKTGEILIRVRAAGVNRPDVFQRMGVYPPPPGASDLPGLEVAGEVVGVAPDVARWRAGDQVCALAPGGGYAEYCAVPGAHALPIPSGYTLSEAAALPETYFTVWHNVFERGGLQPGETLLVHGGSSGIGTTAIQLAKAFGARVIVTAGSKEKCDACTRLGADYSINYRDMDFVEAVKRITNREGANLIVDMVGGSYITRNYEAAAVEGRIVQISVQSGPVAEADFGKLMVKRLTHTGSTLRPRSIEFKAHIAAELERRVWPLLTDRKILPVMDLMFPLANAWRAHERMEAGDHIGKMVLDVA